MSGNILSLDYMRGILQIDPSRCRDSGKGIEEEYYEEDDENNEEE